MWSDSTGLKLCVVGISLTVDDNESVFSQAQLIKIEEDGNISITVSL